MRCPCGNDQTTFDPACRVCGGTGEAPSLGEMPAKAPAPENPIEPGQVWVKIGDGVRTKDVSLTVLEPSRKKGHWQLVSPGGKVFIVGEKTLLSSLYRCATPEPFAFEVTLSGRIRWRDMDFETVLKAVRIGIPGAAEAAKRRAANTRNHAEMQKALQAVTAAMQAYTQRKKDLSQATRDTH